MPAACTLHAISIRDAKKDRETGREEDKVGKTTNGREEKGD
jgi:hypothetical protein